jgi:hypothetical protein
MRSINALILGSVLLALGGCSDDTGAVDGSGSATAGEPTTSGGPDTTSEAESSSSTSLGASESGVMVDPCDDPQVVPAPPVDCSEANGFIDGDVSIGAGDDPSILEGVTRVSGSIQIHGTSLTNLDFMACVQEVGADVTIVGNDQLSNVDGLWSLTSLRIFVFSRNDALEVFDGLPNVSVIPGQIIVRENASLQRIDGFHRLVAIEPLGVDPGTGEAIGGHLVIQQNPVLVSIDGLVGLREIHGLLSLASNPMLCGGSVVSVTSCIEVPATPPPSWCMLEPQGCWDLSC